MDQVIYDLVLKAISTVGFPIFVAVWLLLRTDKFIRKNTEALNDLSEVIKKMCKEEKDG